MKIRHAILVVTMFIAIAAISILTNTATAQTRTVNDAPLVKVGQVYQVLWSCLPQMPCASEWLRIERVRGDGWADTVQCQPHPDDQVTCRRGDYRTRWMVNLTQALQLRQYQAPGHAADH